jgi:hypothetical protein
MVAACRAPQGTLHRAHPADPPTTDAPMLARHPASGIDPASKGAAGIGHPSDGPDRPGA